jgi:Icc-related predicted phosphoesterase
MIKILCISDQVVPIIYSGRARERFADVDMVLSCGDLPYYYMEFVVSMLNVPCYYVHGNHDQPEHTRNGSVLNEPGGWINLDRRAVAARGVLVGGLEGCLRYKPRARYHYTETQMTLRAWQMIPFLLYNRARYGRYLDILITHAPPLGIHDGLDRPHRGFQIFLWFMKAFRPTYLLHGHKHLYGREPWKSKYQETQVVNVHPFRIIEL